MNKRGQDLSIGTLILIVLGIVVLVLLILGFSLGWSNLWEKIDIFGGTSSVGDIVIACKLAHTSQDSYTLCEKTWKVDVEGEKQTVYCRHDLVKGSLDNVPTCAKKTCAELSGTLGDEECVGPSMVEAEDFFEKKFLEKHCCLSNADE